MKRKLLSALLVLTAAAVLYAQPSKTLVAYFSHTGHTAAVAKRIAREHHAELYRIEPARRYPADHNATIKVMKEERARHALPKIAGRLPNVTRYHTIYLGYPIWGGELPNIVITFLKSENFAGKEIIPFCTSNKSSIDKSAEQIKEIVPRAHVRVDLAKRYPPMQ